MLGIYMKIEDRLGYMTIIAMICMMIIICIYKNGITNNTLCIFVVMLIVAVLCLKRKINNSIWLCLYISGIVVVLIAYSLMNFGSWNHNSKFSTDTVWNGDEEHCEALLYTLIKDAKCVVAEDCWIKDYVMLFAKETMIVDSVSGVLKQEDISNLDDFTYEGRHWLRMYDLLTDDQLGELDQQDERLLGFYVNYNEFENAESYVIFNDIDGGVYIENSAEWCD